MLASCAKRSVVPPPQEDVLYQLTFYSATKPDSVMQILDTLDVSVLSKKEQAHYCLLKVGVRDVFFLYDDETDSLLQVAEDYFVGSKEKYFEAETCEALSRIAFKKGKGEQVKLEWLRKALQSIEQCQHVDERFMRFSTVPMTEQEMIDIKKYMLHLRLGLCYLDNNYAEESLIHLKKAERYFAETQYSAMHFTTSIALSNVYLDLKEYDSCLIWCEKGLQVSQALGNAEQIACCHLSKSMYYRYQFEYQDYESKEEGEQLLWNSIMECHKGLALYKGQMFRYKDGLYSELNRCFYQLEQYDSCIYYAEKQIDFLNAMHFEIVPNVENAGIFYRLYKSHNALGHQEKALEYADLYFEMQQVLEKQPKAVEQVKNEYDKKLEMNQLQHEQQMKRYRLYLLLVLSFLVIVVVLWFTNQYRKNKEIELLRQQEAYRKLQSDFEEASKQSLQALQQHVMAIYRTGEGDILGQILSEFDVAYPKALDKLRSAYPKLTESERNIVILTFLGFRTKEEAEIMHLSLNTVEKYRTNIRKKANQDPVSDLIR